MDRLALIIIIDQVVRVYPVVTGMYQLMALVLLIKLLFMKKIKKYLILVFLFLIFIVALFYIFLSKPNTIKKEENKNPIINISSSTNPVSGFSVMTLEERKALRISSTTNIQVIRRSATGTPTDYRIIK